MCLLCAYFSPINKSWGTRSAVSENLGLQGCDTVSSNSRRILDCLTSEDEGTTFFRNVGDQWYGINAIKWQNYLGTWFGLWNWIQLEHKKVLSSTSTRRPKPIVRTAVVLMFCWPCITLYRYNETNVVHFSINLVKIKSLYVFRELLAHPQEAPHKRHLVYFVRVMSVGCTRIEVSQGLQRIKRNAYVCMYVCVFFKIYCMLHYWK
jgi:hypothetical protein